MTTLLLLRFIKTVAILLLAAATTGAFVPQEHRTRQHMVYGVGTAALALTWLSGFGLLRQVGWPLRTPWVAGSVLLSVAWFGLVVFAVEQPRRKGAGWAMLTAGTLVAAVALMVFRPG